MSYKSHKKIYFPEVPLPVSPDAFQANAEWRDEAACRKPEVNTQLWFPERSRGKGTHEALRTCATCLVKKECLDYAIEAPELHGIWGGMMEKERRIERRKREREAAMGERQGTVMALGPL